MAAQLCRNRVEFGGEENYYLFLNSVNSITAICEMAGLTPENTRIVCSDNPNNRGKMKNGFTISAPGDNPKVINFFTSACFEGCDVFDKRGRTFIVCDPRQKNTLLDIRTSMQQICGRIRNSDYRYEMVLIYNTTLYDDAENMPLFMKGLMEERATAEKRIQALNMADQAFRDWFINRNNEFDMTKYIVMEEDGLCAIDECQINLEIINYNTMHNYYNSQFTLRKELTNNNFAISKDYYAKVEKYNLLATNKTSFRDVCEQYASIKAEQPPIVFVEDERLQILRNMCAEACQAVDKLGIDAIRELKYHRSNIRKRMVKISGKKQDVKIKSELDCRLQKYEAYPTAKIREILADVYELVGLKKVARATDLKA